MKGLIFGVRTCRTVQGFCQWQHNWASARWFCCTGFNLLGEPSARSVSQWQTARSKGPAKRLSCTRSAASSFKTVSLMFVAAAHSMAIVVRSHVTSSNLAQDVFHYSHFRGSVAQHQACEVLSFLTFSTLRRISNLFLGLRCPNCILDHTGMPHGKHSSIIFQAKMSPELQAHNAFGTWQSAFL